MRNRFFIILLTALFTVINSYGQSTSVASYKPDLNKNDVLTVLKAVADWQMNEPLKHHELDWTNAALYAGMAEWAPLSGDIKYYEWLKSIGAKNGWKYYEHPKQPLRRYHADDYCVGQMYIELYRHYREKEMINPMRTYLDQILKDPAKGDLVFKSTVPGYSSQQRWSWCDALFMAPTVWAKMAKETGKKKYLEFMYAEYKATTDYLYDKEEKLYFRDSNYFTRKEANGEKIFWGRGNGWVFAGLPIIIRELPSKWEHRDYFINIYREMAGRLVELQQPDGSWHASLLDPASYPVPEMSCTAFFVFGLAWGVDNGYLEKERFMPAVEAGWKSMVSNVWPNGMVGSIQPIGADPKAVTREMTEVYGVGGFLMAGAQIYKMVE